VQINELPWQAGLVSDGGYFVWCGGTLISDQWVLTAAHCTISKNAEDIEVLLGEHDYYDDYETESLRAGVAEIINHWNYDDPTTDNDYALLKLSSPVDFSAYPHIRPACLPKLASVDYAGFTGTISGWGTTESGGDTSNVLLAANVTIISNEECRSSMGYSITDQMMCAAAPDTDTCQGDSGGPLVVPNPELYEVVGVTSWGYGCAGSTPGVYARVTSALGWIEQNTVGTWNTCGDSTFVNSTYVPTPSPISSNTTYWPAYNSTYWPQYNGTYWPPTTSDCVCGVARRRTRIVNGVEVEVNELPWQAGLVSYDSSYVTCGGTLVSDQWVVTAAHCTIYSSASDKQVLLGEHDYWNDWETTTLRMNIENIINHHNYDSESVDYDYALIKLSQPVDFNQYPHIRPACLPYYSTVDYSGFTGIISGWGTTSSGGSTSSVLLAANVTIMSNEMCRSSTYSYGFSITDQMMCAAAPDTDTCQGDSGGPLVVANPELYELVGITSWGYGCAGADPGVYARVTSVLDWIASNTENSWNTCGRDPNGNSTYIPPVTYPPTPYNTTYWPPNNSTHWPNYNSTSWPTEGPSNDYCILNDIMIPSNSMMLRPLKCEYINCYANYEGGVPSLHISPAYDGTSTNCCVSPDGYYLYQEDMVYYADDYTYYTCSNGAWMIPSNMTATIDTQMVFPF